MHHKDLIQHCAEAITQTSDLLKIDYNVSDGGISTKLGKGKRFAAYESKVDDTIVYSLYSVSGGNADLLANLKKKLNVDPIEYERFITRSAIFAVAILKDKRIDTIISPKSSGLIISDVLHQIRVRLPHLVVIDGALLKGTAIRILPVVKPDSELRRSLEKIVAKSNEVKKIPPRWRQYIQIDFVLSDGTKSLAGEHVLIFDDILSKGVTMRSMTNALKGLYRTLPLLTAMTIFKTE